MERYMSIYIHHRITRTALCFLVFCLAASTAAFCKDSSTCTPNFPLKDGWLGADAAYSIPLPDGRDIWIFGDTLYGKHRVVTNGDPRMVRNSLGISTCKDGRWHLNYVIRHDSAGNPLTYFQEQKPDTWYWALDGVYYNKNLWVTLLCLRNTPKDAGNPFGFETCGTDLAKVSDLDANPQKWKVKYFPLVPDGTHAYPSATTVIEGDYLYIFALYEKATRPMLLTRIPLKGLNDPAKNLQYLATNGSWKPGFVPDDAEHVMADGSTEMSVRYHPQLKEWLAVLMDPAFFSNKILLRTAPELTGPWSTGRVIYNIPEMEKDKPGYDKDTFCYAAKEHPEFREPGSILFTYVCNTTQVDKLPKELNIYFPKVVRVPLLATDAPAIGENKNTR